MKLFKLLLIALLIKSITVQAQTKKVLFVMSAAKELRLENGKIYPETGVFLSEFYLVYKDIVNLGYEIEFATPNGIMSSIEKESYDKKYWGKRDTLISEAGNFVRHDKKFDNSLTLEQAFENIHTYSGMVIPGGQGLMVDLFYDHNIPKIL